MGDGLAFAGTLVLTLIGAFALFEMSKGRVGTTLILIMALVAIALVIVGRMAEGV
jgi:hypothetical protein